MDRLPLVGGVHPHGLQVPDERLVPQGHPQVPVDHEHHLRHGVQHGPEIVLRPQQGELHHPPLHHLLLQLTVQLHQLGTLLPLALPEVPLLPDALQLFVQIAVGVPLGEVQAGNVVEVAAQDAVHDHLGVGGEGAEKEAWGKDGHVVETDDRQIQLLTDVVKLQPGALRGNLSGQLLRDVHYQPRPAVPQSLGLLDQRPHLFPDGISGVAVHGRLVQGHQDDRGVGVHIKTPGPDHLLQGGQGRTEHEGAHLPLPDAVLEKLGDHVVHIVQAMKEQGRLLPRRHDEGRPGRGDHIIISETVGTCH
ncbi:hypothetical protein DSECCO2_251520 [anaerobic digester metagenome]